MRMGVSKTTSALDSARSLASELPDRAYASTRGAEFDDHAWWEEHAELFEQARSEYGVLHPELYDLAKYEEEMIHPNLLKAVREVRHAAAAALSSKQNHPSLPPSLHAFATEKQLMNEERNLLSLLEESSTVSGVYTLPIFTPLFCTMLREELRHLEASGIPLRRPNGMNRFGAILDFLGMEESFTHFLHKYLSPIAQLVFPHLVSVEDATEHYAFAVHYASAPGGDVALAEHADASVVTLNVNLDGRGNIDEARLEARRQTALSGPSKYGILACGEEEVDRMNPTNYTGGQLAFRGVRFIDKAPQQKPVKMVDFKSFPAGSGILHLGGHYHAALPLTSGERTNLVVWAFGEHGVVRVAPYSKQELSQHSHITKWLYRNAG